MSQKMSVTVVIILSLIALVTSGMAAFTWMDLKKARQQADGELAPAALAAHAQPLFMPLEAFTVSLQPDEHENDRVLYVGLTLRLQDQKSLELVEAFLPEFRSRLLMLFSTHTAASLATSEGKALMVEQIKQALSKQVIDGHSPVVTNVLFNAFILR